MKVLLITKQLPDTGTSNGVEALSTRLKRVFLEPEFDTHYLSLDVFSGCSNRIRRWKAEVSLGWPFYAKAGIDKSNVFAVLERHRPEVIVVEHIEILAAIEDFLPRLRVQGVPIVLISHGCHSLDFFWIRNVRGFRELPKKILHDAFVGRQMELESRLFESVDAVWVLNENEQAIVRWQGARRTYVLPPVCISDDVCWSPIAGRLGFVGTLTHRINSEGLDWVMETISRRVAPQGLKLRVVGAVPKDLAKRWRSYQFAELLGPLNDAALRAEVSSWHALLHPLFRWAKGRSLKVSSAMEWGIPLVSTPCGVRGYPLLPDKAFVNAHDKEEFASRISEIITSPCSVESTRQEMIRVRTTECSLSEAARSSHRELQSLVASFTP